MAEISLTPTILSDSLFTIDGNEYQGSVSNVTFTPATSTQTFKGLTPSSVFTGQTTPTYTVAITYAQDWDTADSLSRVLFEHQGETVDIEFAPNNLTGKSKVTASVIITPGAIGGAVDTYATATVTLGVLGAPVLGTVSA